MTRWLCYIGLHWWYYYQVAYPRSRRCNRCDKFQRQRMDHAGGGGYWM